MAGPKSFFTCLIICLCGLIYEADLAAFSTSSFNYASYKLAPRVTNSPCESPRELQTRPTSYKLAPQVTNSPRELQTRPRHF